MFHGVLWGNVLVETYFPLPVLKYGYSCQSECSQTNGKLVSCGIYPRRTLKLSFSSTLHLTCRSSLNIWHVCRCIECKYTWRLINLVCMLSRNTFCRYKQALFYEISLRYLSTEYNAVMNHSKPVCEKQPLSTLKERSGAEMAPGWSRFQVHRMAPI